MKLIHLSIAGLISVTTLSAQSFIDKLNTDFLTDTVTISTDSLTFELMDVNVVDKRPNAEDLFLISGGDKSDTAVFPDSTRKQKFKKRLIKWVYGHVPIDIIYEMDQPIVILFGAQSGTTGNSARNTLIINHFDYWYDSAMPKKQKRILNAHTQLQSPLGDIINECQWDVYLKRDEGESLAGHSGRIFEKWVREQKEVLQSNTLNPISPLPYKRMLTLRVDNVVLQNGFLWDWRLTLNYPKDQIKHYKRGLPRFGFTYQKTADYETYGMGEKGKLEVKRLNNRFISRLSYGYRIGTVRYNWKKLDSLKVEYWPFLKLMATYNTEYHPRFYEGFYAGFGIYQGLNVWPPKLPLSETGLLITIGVVLR